MRHIEEDGKQISYVGQSVNIGERWKQHAKRAWGISSGIEQWKWEIVERVDDRDKLNEREVYRGDFYCCKEAGLG